MVIEYANYLVNAGHEVTLYVKEMKTVFTINPRIRIRMVPSFGKVGFLFYGASHKLGHDIIVVDIIHLPLLLSISNKVVYYAQADDREYYGNPLIKKAIEILYTLHFRSGKPVISMSQHLTEIFQRRYNIINTIYTIKTGIDHDSFYYDPDNNLVKQKGGKKTVVFMARGDSYRKGYDIALKVFRSLGKDIADKMELWVCGSKLNESNFHFPVRNFGVVDDSRLRKILSSSDIFFYPSRHEGFGLFPLEAMACGCVAVTTEAIPYARETSSIFTSPVDDVEGLTNNIKRLVTDTNLLELHRKNVAEIARKYDLKESKIAFEAALRALISKTV